MSFCISAFCLCTPTYHHLQANYYIAFSILSNALEDPNFNLVPAIRIVNRLLNYFYVGLVLMCFILSLGNRPQGSKWGYTLAFVGFAFITIYMTVCLGLKIFLGPSNVNHVFFLGFGILAGVQGGGSSGRGIGSTVPVWRRFHEQDILQRGVVDGGDAGTVPYLLFPIREHELIDWLFGWGTDGLSSLSLGICLLPSFSICCWRHHILTCSTFMP